MLPNFRRTEPEAAIQPSAANDHSKALPTRSIFANQRNTERAAISIIGPDLVINGNLISKGEVQVDGIVEGDVHGSHVVVGPSATISGGIVAEEIVIRGHVTGSVRGKRVMLQATSQVEGDIYHNALSIEQGAMFEGKSRRMTEDPRSIAAPQARPAATTAVHLTDFEPEADVTIVPPRLPAYQN